MPTHGARLPAATDHRDPIRANIREYNVTWGGIRLQAAIAARRRHCRDWPQDLGTSGVQHADEPKLAAGRPCSRRARGGVSAHRVIRLSRSRLKHAAATRQSVVELSCLSVPGRERVDYIRGWTSGEVGSIVIATAISHKPLQEVLRDRGILARDLLEALPAAVYLTDAAGRLTFYNRAAADLWGWRPDLGSTRWCGSWRLFWPDGTPLPHDQCPMAVAIQQNRQVRGVAAHGRAPGRRTGAIRALPDAVARSRWRADSVPSTCWWTSAMTGAAKPCGTGGRTRDGCARRPSVARTTC